MAPSVNKKQQKHLVFFQLSVLFQCIIEFMDNIKQASGYRGSPDESVRSTAVHAFCYYYFTVYLHKKQSNNLALANNSDALCSSVLLYSVSVKHNHWNSMQLRTMYTRQAETTETLSLFLLRVYTAFWIFQEIKLVCGMILSTLWSAGFAAAS